jgi:hypothetical protein
MNIFRTSDDPVECAIVLADKHVIKMAVETAQILAGALRLRGATDEKLYKLTHKKHPCVLWVASSQEAAEWTLKHGFALCDEYQRRFQKEHGSLKQLKIIESQGFSAIPTVPAPAVPKCVAEDLTVLSLHDAYRAALQRKYATWKHIPRWTRTQQPSWVPVRVKAAKTKEKN